MTYQPPKTRAKRLKPYPGPNLLSATGEPLSKNESYKETNRVFLAALASGQTFRKSAMRAGKSEGCFVYRRRNDPEFAAAWAKAAEIGAQFEADVRQKFLELLHSGLAVNAAARLVGRCLIQLTENRRQDPAFDAAWVEAVAVGREKKIAKLKNLDFRPFFVAVSQGSAIETAAAELNLPVSSLYFLKRHDPEFAEMWARALQVKKNEGQGLARPNAD